MNSPTKGRKCKTIADEVICLCNEVTRSAIETAIREGAHSTNQLFDKTGAGVGACGGTCRKFTGPLIDYYLKNNEFPPGKIRKK